MDRIKYKVAVMSGKGGVGKSAVTVNLSALLAMRGYKVGIADADLNGPSVAKMTGVRGRKLDASEDVDIACYRILWDEGYVHGHAFAL